ncbi:MAG: uracil-DNA glycosylase [Reichenbachiella sp.]
MDVKIEQSWERLLFDEFQQDYFKNLVDFVKNEYANSVVFPPAKDIFSAFDNSPFGQTKVVIIGQDPYHGIGQANGLCFSVQSEMKLPPSLKNIFKEVHDDLGKPIPTNGDLLRWAKQGVLLLNATLTVQAHEPGSHQNKGWEQFTDAVIRKISEEKKNIVYLLWGAFAQKKGAFIDRQKHLVLESPHPSPFAAHKGFFGNKHFSKTNDYMKSFNIKEIDW